MLPFRCVPYVNSGVAFLGANQRFLIPALVLGSIGLLALKGLFDSKITAVLMVVLSVIFLLGSICYMFMLSIWTATTDTEDVKYYSRAFAQIEDGNGVKGMFPQSIPSDAKDISFHYNPPFLQGGEEFKLSYTVTEEKCLNGLNCLKARRNGSGPMRNGTIKIIGAFMTRIPL